MKSKLSKIKQYKLQSRCIFTNFSIISFLEFFHEFISGNFLVKIIVSVYHVLRNVKTFWHQSCFLKVFFFCWKNKRFSIGILPETSCVDVTNRHNSSLQIFCAKENSRASLLFENLIFHRSLEWFMFIRQNFSIFSGEDDDEKFDCCGFLRNNIKVEQEPL